jgi:hypothetical protein
MTYRKLLLSMTVAACAAGNALAGDIYPGHGIPYAAKFVFHRDDTRPGAPALSVHSGQTIPTPNDGGSPASIPTTRSMAWCDPAVMPPGGAPGTCYGSARHSQWFLIDLSRLRRQGLRRVKVTINAKRYAGAEPAKSDLIPALTVWRGNQTLGPTLDWFPSQHQATPPFWGWLLHPWIGQVNPGFLSAHGVGPQTEASISDTLTLSGRLVGPRADFLTVAVGGDAKHADPKQEHAVHFQFEVDVKRARRGLRPGDIDPLGCVVGQTCWHPPMVHCMAVDLCNLPQYLNECQCFAPAP